MKRFMALSGLVGSGVAWGSPVDVVRLASSLRESRLAEAPRIPESAYSAALAGKVRSGIVQVPESKAAKAWAVGVVDAPIAATWMALNDESRMGGRMPVEVSAVVSGTVKGTPRRVFEYLPLPLVSDRWWVVDMHANAPLFAASDGQLWELAWTDATDPAHLEGTAFASKAAEGFPVAWTKGAWLLMDLGDNRTLVEHFSWSDPGGRVPAGLASRFGGSALKDALAAVNGLAQDAATRSSEGFTRPDGSPL